MSTRKITTQNYYSKNSSITAPTLYRDRIVTYNDGTTVLYVHNNKIIDNVSNNASRRCTGYALSRSLVLQAIQQHNNELGISTKSPVKLTTITSEAGKIWIASLPKDSQLTLTKIWNGFNVAMKQPGAYEKYVLPVLTLYTNEIMFSKQSGSKSGSALEAFLTHKVKKTGQIVSPIRQSSGNLQTELDYYRNYGTNTVPTSTTSTKTVKNSQVGSTKKSKTKVNNATTSYSSM